jgi:hypothetical protein
MGSMIRRLLFAVAAAQSITLLRPAFGTVVYLRSRDLLASQRASVIAAITLSTADPRCAPGLGARPLLRHVSTPGANLETSA